MCLKYLLQESSQHLLKECITSGTQAPRLPPMIWVWASLKAQHDLCLHTNIILGSATTKCPMEPWWSWMLERRFTWGCGSDVGSLWIHGTTIPLSRATCFTHRILLLYNLISVNYLAKCQKGLFNSPEIVSHVSSMWMHLIKRLLFQIIQTKTSVPL